MTDSRDLHNPALTIGKDIRSPPATPGFPSVGHGHCRSSIQDPGGRGQRKHERIKERRFVCIYNGCSAKFAKKFNLGVHERIHSGERPHVCRVQGCGERFRWRSGLRSHSWKQHGCGKSESRSSQNSNSDETCLSIHSASTLAIEIETQEAQIHNSPNNPTHCSADDLYLEMIRELQHQQFSWCNLFPSPGGSGETHLDLSSWDSKTSPRRLHGFSSNLDPNELPFF
mmetsp:Transcript_16845/g.34840  ORF Transcript_16845/g.34840 Transcript_16845/m.34840 type:complete len:227 (-) Transcript_16845:648-1328(-)